MGAAEIALVAVLAAAALLFSSFSSVSQNEYGLLFNWVTKTISPEVYHGGRHFIGPWNNFVIFPATVQTIEFSERGEHRSTESLHTRTKEGLGLHLSIAFQYKLIKEQIPELYKLTNTMYEGLFTRIARDQLLESASEYEGPQYWKQRADIADRMAERVGKSLNTSHCNLWSLQLLDINLPTKYEDSITETQVQNQLIQTRLSQQKAAAIRADTEILKADFDRRISVVQAGAQANFTMRTKLAQATALSRKVDAEAEALEYARKAMHLSPEESVRYTRLMAYSNLENATILSDVAGLTPTLSFGSLRGAQPHVAEGAQEGEEATDILERRRA